MILCLSLHIQYCPEFIVIKTRRNREQMDDRLIHIEHPMHPIKTFLQAVNKIINLSGSQINIKYYVLYNRNK